MNRFERTHRKLFLRELTHLARIGAHDFERARPQRLVFNIDLYVPLSQSTSANDRLDEVVDYDFVRRVVQDAIATGHIDLQETLCDRVVDALLAHPGIDAVRVSTHKPDVYPDCRAVGVERFAEKQDKHTERNPS